MPWLPNKKPCRVPGCPGLVDGKDHYCLNHKKFGYSEGKTGNKHVDQRHVSPRWIKYRKWYLAKNPLCVQCKKEGRIVKATVVDHIVRVNNDTDPLFWDETNHQSLCIYCHNVKTGKGL